MEYLGIGFILLCFFWGKAELVDQRTKSLLAVLALLPEEERQARAREFLEQNGKQ